MGPSVQIVAPSSIPSNLEICAMQLGPFGGSFAGSAIETQEICVLMVAGQKHITICRNSTFNKLDVLSVYLHRL